MKNKTYNKANENRVKYEKAKQKRDQLVAMAEMLGEADGGMVYLRMIYVPKGGHMDSMGHAFEAGPVSEFLMERAAHWSEEMVELDKEFKRL